MPSVPVLFIFFFFQAEDGIRDGTVTGVQTCALPIFAGRASAASTASQSHLNRPGTSKARLFELRLLGNLGRFRSEERRVGKECRSRWWADDENKKEIHVCGAMVRVCYKKYNSGTRSG